jgi:hypothetical protein
LCYCGTASLGCGETVSARLSMFEALFGKHSNTLRGDYFCPSVRPSIYTVFRIIKFCIGVAHQKLSSNCEFRENRQSHRLALKEGVFWVPTQLFIFIYWFGSNSVLQAFALYRWAQGAHEKSHTLQKGVRYVDAPLCTFRYRVTE